jgi:hypothetical protein
MNDDKDRLGEKLHQKEKAEEDRYFAERDKAILEKLRGEKRAADETEIRQLAQERCPRCGARLVPVTHHGVAVDECPAGHGMWLDEGELATLAKRERDSWLGRFFFRPKPVP